MKTLGDRARQNGIIIEDVYQVGLQQMEPNINGLAALYSPTTGITNYKQVTQVMSELFLARGGAIHFAPVFSLLT